MTNVANNSYNLKYFLTFKIFFFMITCKILADFASNFALFPSQIPERGRYVWFECCLTQFALLSDDKETSQTELGWLLLWLWAGQYKYMRILCCWCRVLLCSLESWLHQGTGRKQNWMNLKQNHQKYYSDFPFIETACIFILHWNRSLQRFFFWSLSSGKRYLTD